MKIIYPESPKGLRVKNDSKMVTKAMCLEVVPVCQCRILQHLHNGNVLKVDIKNVWS